MKKSVIVIGLLLVLLLSITLISASPFSEFWNNLLGKNVQLNPETYTVSITSQPSITGNLAPASCGNKAPKINVKTEKGALLGSFEFQFNPQEQTLAKTLTISDGSQYFIFSFENDCCLDWNGQYCANGDLNLNIKKISINGREKVLNKMFYSQGDMFSLYKNLGKIVSITNSELITTDKCSKGEIAIKCTTSDTTISLFSYTDIPDSHINQQNPYKVEYSGNQMIVYSYYTIPKNTVGTFKAGCYLDNSASNSDLAEVGIYGARDIINPGIKEYTLNSCMTQNCEDATDQANDISIKGVCVDYPNGVTTNHPDICDTAPEIVEKKLWQTNCNSATKTCDATFSNCPVGTSCSDGKCVSSGGTIPICTDECSRGESSCYDQYYQNFCEDLNNDGCTEIYQKRCLNGCVNGVCVGGSYNPISILSPTNNQEISCLGEQECNLQLRWRTVKEPDLAYAIFITKLDEDNQPIINEIANIVIVSSTDTQNPANLRAVNEGNNEYSYQLNLNDDYTGPNNNLRTLKSLGYGKFQIRIQLLDFTFYSYSDLVTYTKIQLISEQRGVIARAIQKVVEAIKEFFSG